MDTFFAPAERLDHLAVSAQAASLISHPVATAMLEALSGVVLVLNSQRQVLAINSTVLDLLGLDEPLAVLGMRPGEVLECHHAARAPSGCGTGEPCRQCGAVLAILACARTQQPQEQRCLITRAGGDLYFLARATPLSVEEQVLTVLTLLDLSDQAKRQHLERVFLHDLSNSVVRLQSSSLDLQDDESGIYEGVLQEVDHIIEMIRGERQRLHLQAGTYRPSLTPTRVDEVTERVVRSLRGSPLAEQRSIHLQAGPTLALRLDEVLLVRVLDNMLRNALEATLEGGAVRVRVEQVGAHLRVEVHNPGYIPGSVQSRIFTRWYSTKGEGRGLGTWSMRHLTEGYLGGRVDFCSTLDEGTRFWLELPLST